MARGRPNVYVLFGGFLLILASTNYFALRSEHAQLALEIGNHQQQLKDIHLGGFQADNEGRIYALQQACKHHGLDGITEETLCGDTSLARQKRLTLSLSHSQHSQYFIVRQKTVNIVWCKVYKSASTSWMSILKPLAGHHVSVCQRSQRKQSSWRKPVEPMHREEYKQHKEQYSDLVLTLSEANAISFLVARNPYERLVSAYRDKIETGYFREISTKILAKYRNVSAVWMPGHPNCCPAFKEFVRYVLDEFRAGNELNVHWAPVYSVCNPCQVNVTHIIKFETFDRDTGAVLQKTNLSHLLPPNGKLKTQNVRGPKSASLVVSYLNQLTPELLGGLRKIYDIDFDLFQYDKQEHFRFLQT